MQTARLDEAQAGKKTAGKSSNTTVENHQFFVAQLNTTVQNHQFFVAQLSL